MKKYKIFAYIFVVLFFILAISFGTYQVISSNNKPEDKLEGKIKSEIKYLDEELTNTFNKMNNIQFESYKLSVNEINPSSSEKNSQSSSGGSSGQESQGGKQSKGGSGSSEESNSKGSEGSESSGSSEGGSGSEKSSSSGSSQSSDEEQIKTFTLEQTGVLTQDSEIDWKTIKNNIETIYISLPTVTLDLYQTEIDKQEILDFNTAFDVLSKVVQEEKKKETLEQLVNVYGYLTKFVDKEYKDEQSKTAIKAKNNVFKAYSKLDNGNWQEIANDIKIGVEEFSKIMTSTDLKEQKQYTVNKTYIMLNELLKSTEQQNSQIFLIKYKNTLEELNNL